MASARALVRFAWLTPRATGAIAIVRIWGPGGIALATRLLEKAPPPTPRLARRWLAWDGERIDEVVVRSVRGTGADQEWCEFATHGGGGVTLAVREALVAAGAVEAPYIPPLPRGRAEAELAIARAPSELALDAALFQRHGAFDLALARVAAGCGSGPDADRAALEAASLAGAADLGEALFAPRCAVIAGPSGVGKSRLFNALLGEDRSMTGVGEPVTRDWLAEPLEVRGVPFVLVDTPADPEIAGRAVARADVLVRLHRAGEAPWPPSTWAPGARTIDRIGGADAADLACELLRPFAPELERGVDRALPVHPAQVALARALGAATPRERSALVCSYLSAAPAPWPGEEER